ncbi:hypothetical protein [Frigidibacter mobilis]|nr:hypothetical protein [Frigidibacter mobilis]
MAMLLLRWLGGLPRRATALCAFLRQDAAERRALRDIVQKPHDHWIEDAGLTRDEAQRLLEQSTLHRLAQWIRAGGR